MKKNVLLVGLMLVAGLVFGQVNERGNKNFTAEVNFDGDVKLKGTKVTSSATELNIMDGVTKTAAEINAIGTVGAISLASNQVIIGSALGYGYARTISGVIVITTNGVTSFTDSDLNTWAGITPSENAQALLLLTYAGMRTNLSLVVGTDVQAYDADLDTWATVTPSANGKTLVALVSYAAMRTNLNLVIGTDVQAYDADLDTWATVTPSNDGKSLVAAADYSVMRTNLNLVIGTDVQAYDADLDTYAGITPSANMQTLLGSATFAAARTNLGLVVGADVLAYDANTMARAGTAGKSVTNTFLTDTDTVTNVQIFINGLLTSWTTNSVEIE